MDNLNEYYDVRLKNERLKLLEADERFNFYKIDLADQESLNQLFEHNRFPIVINLAAGQEFVIVLPIHNPMFTPI